MPQAAKACSALIVSKVNDAGLSASRKE